MMNLHQYKGGEKMKKLLLEVVLGTFLLVVVLVAWQALRDPRFMIGFGKGLLTWLP